MWGVFMGGVWGKGYALSHGPRPNQKGSGARGVHEVKGKSAHAFLPTPNSGLRLGVSPAPTLQLSTQQGVLPVHGTSACHGCQPALLAAPHLRDRSRCS